MLNKEITIVNKLGLHARAAAKFVSLASGFKREGEVLAAESIIEEKIKRFIEMCRRPVPPG